MTFVVVGASLAGLRAVESARRSGYRGRVVLVGAEEHPPYDRPPLSKACLAPDGPDGAEPFRTEAELRDELGVELLLGVAADGLDTAGRAVSVAGKGIRYDALVIATGATARSFPGAQTLRTAADAPSSVRHSRAGRGPWSSGAGSSARRSRRRPAGAGCP